MAHAIHMIMFNAAEVLKRLSDLIAELKLSNLAPLVTACQRQLGDNDLITVGVLGRFKAGKSSLLNHLAQRPILPVGVLPVTSVVTRLRFGAVEKALVRFLDGSAQEIPVSDLDRFVTEDKNPNNQFQVAEVEVQLPTLQTYAPVQFVDTPGLDSTLIYNTETTLNWLPQAGAVLVAISVDAPLSQQDLALLEQVRRFTPKLAVLLTKTDLLPESERVSVRAFVARQLKEKWNAEIPVFFYSTREVHSGFQAELDQHLLAPLIRDRAKTNDQILIHKLALLVSQTLDYLQLALAAATQAETARRALQEKLYEERHQFDLLRRELRLLAREWDGQALEWSLARLHPVQRALQAKLDVQLQTRFPAWRSRLPAFVETYRTWLQEFFFLELSLVSRSQRRMFCEPLEKVRHHLERMLQAFQDRLAYHVKAALGLSLTPREFVLEVEEPSGPPVDVGVAFDVPMEVFGYLIPMWACRRSIERHLLRRARYEVEKNISRLAAAWRDRVSVAIDELTRQAEQYAQDELGALGQMLTQDQTKKPDLRRAIHELERMKEQLDRRGSGWVGPTNMRTS